MSLVDDALPFAALGAMQDPNDRLRGAVVALVAAGMLAPPGELDRLRAAADVAHRRVAKALDYLASIDTSNGDLLAVGWDLVAMLDGPGDPGPCPSVSPGGQSCQVTTPVHRVHRHQSAESDAVTSWGGAS